MNDKPKSRWYAFAIHLLISLAIFILLAALIIYVWYPGFLFYTDGGWQGLRLLAGVDFIIGPILTLVVYKAGKPGLARDLFVIGLIQAACLFAGLWLVHQERTLAVVYADGSLHTMAPSSFKANYDDISEVELLNTGWAPHWIYVDLPMDKDGRSEFRRRALFDGMLHSRIDLYKPFADHLESIAIEGEPFNDSETVRNYKLVARYSSGWISIDTDSGEVVDFGT